MNRVIWNWTRGASSSGASNRPIGGCAIAISARAAAGWIVSPVKRAFAAPGPNLSSPVGTSIAGKSRRSAARGDQAPSFSPIAPGAASFARTIRSASLAWGALSRPPRLAEMMLELQSRGCHNINFVTPTHFVPQLLAALPEAIAGGLHIPLVYNSSGYESVETLRLLEGVVDIYLPDAKYADDAVARELSGFVDYVEHDRAALREMYRQVGDELLLDEDGIARRGMIIRHMILPENLAGTAEVLQWIAQELGPRVHVSVMSQYFVAHKAVGHPQLGRKITEDEYEAALDAFAAAGLECGWQQEHELEQRLL